MSPAPLSVAEDPRFARTLPHNLEAERSVLGAILIDNGTFNVAAALIDDKAFFRDSHKRIFAAMVTLSEKGKPLDLTTLKNELERVGNLEEVGGPAYVASLVDGVPRSTNVHYYAEIVREKAALRKLIFAGQKMINTAYDAEDEADLILDAAEREIFSIADAKLTGGFMPMSGLVKESFPKVERLLEQKTFITGVPTGFDEIDRKTRGLQAGDLVIVAARPSMGKTSLVLNICQHVATHGGVAGFFSLEMSREALFMRMLATEARIDFYRLTSGQISQREYGQLTHALETLNNAALFIDDTASIGVLEMRAKARRLKAEHGLSVLAIDYVQLMTSRERVENRNLELGAISRSLKGLAKELGIPIIVLSQLSRAPEARSDKRPMLSDLRESGNLEQDADVVALLFREEMYKTDDQPADSDGIAEVIVAKQRNGPTGTVKLAFIREQTRFGNLAAPVFS